MRHVLCAPAFLALFALAGSPAHAQLNPATGDGGPTSPQPHAPAPDIAPPALPGAGDQPGLATVPQVAKPVSGDPTTALFAAVNSGNYSAAQDAISRGADPNAQNDLGETPLDLSIALNHNNITFMLLSARNEGGADASAGEDLSAVPQPAAAAAAPAGNASHHIYQAAAGPAPAPPPRTTPGNDPGIPNPQAGFLGFSHGP